MATNPTPRNVTQIAEPHLYLPTDIVDVPVSGGKPPDGANVNGHP